MKRINAITIGDTVGLEFINKDSKGFLRFDGEKFISSHPMEVYTETPLIPTNVYANFDGNSYITFYDVNIQNEIIDDIRIEMDVNLEYFSEFNYAGMYQLFLKDPIPNRNSIAVRIAQTGAADSSPFLFVFDNVGREINNYPFTGNPSYSPWVNDFITISTRLNNFQQDENPPTDITTSVDELSQISYPMGIGPLIPSGATSFTIGKSFTDANIFKGKIKEVKLYLHNQLILHVPDLSTGINYAPNSTFFQTPGVITGTITQGIL